jgi:hypothetical protein
VEFHEGRADAGVGGEVWREGDARQFALEVRCVAGAVLGVMEQGVGVVEDVAFGGGFLAVVTAELGESPVGDVFAASFVVLFLECHRGNVLNHCPVAKVRGRCRVSCLTMPMVCGEQSHLE